MITSLETEEAAPGTTERRNGAPSLDGTALSPASASSAATDALWQAVLDDLERDPSISRASFATWLRSTRLLAVADGAFVVGAQHTFALQKLERSFRGPVEQALRRQTGNAAARVRFIVARAPGATRAPEATPRPLPLKTSGTDESRRTKDESGRSSFVFRPPSGADSTLNPGWTFETFAVDRQNQFAYAAACAVADNPSFAYNPLVLFGPPGAGKTHLLHAIGQRVVAVRAGARVRYLPARALAAEWLRCGADVATFAAYREQAARADVLLLDDLHLLPALGPVSTGLQREVARLVAALLAADAQVVVASQPAPKTLGGLDDALRRRLHAGLVAEVGVRAAFPPGRAALPGPVGAAPAQRARRRVGPDDILAAVAAYFGLPVEALQAKRRDRETVLPRQVAMFLMREETEASLSEIGARLGGRDHATVLHGYEKIATQLAADESLRTDLAAVRERLAAACLAGGGAAAAAAAAAAP